MTRRITAILTLCTMAIATMYGQTKDYTLTIGDFSEFTVSHGLNVIYCQNVDSAGTATFTCEPQIAHAITFSNKSNKLKIEVISDEPITSPLPTVTIYSATLNKATNLGDSTVTLQRVNKRNELSLRVLGNGLLKAHNITADKLTASSEAGNGHIYANGSCTEASYTVLGAGAVECGDVKASKVKVKMAGTGSIDCNAEHSLTVYGLGSGSVYYAGDPEIKNRNLGVKLVHIDR